MATDGFYCAKNMNKRMTLTNLKDLKKDETVYQDNASAIFFDF